MKKITVLAFVLGVFLLGPLTSSAQIANNNSSLDSLYQTLLNLASQVNALSQGGGAAAVSTAVTSSASVVAPLAVNLVSSTNIVATGGSALLSWTSTSAASCVASGAWSGTLVTAGSFSVTPSVTSTYTLTCSSTLGANVSQSVTVSVLPRATGALPFNIGDAVMVNHPQTIRQTPSTSGVVLGAQLASSVGTIIAGPISANGSLWWNVDYSGNSVDGWGIENYLVRAGTYPSDPNSHLYFTAVPSGTVASGQAVTLTFSPSSDVTSCSASGGWTGSMSTGGGTVVVKPTVTTTYTLMCSGVWGSVTKSITINVTQPSPIPTVTISASPTSIPVGQSTTLTWSSTNATSCTASGGWSGAQSTSGSVTVTPTINSTYTLSCAGFGVTNAQSVTVTVSQLPIIATYNYTTASYTLGDPSASYYINWLAKNATSCVSSGGVTGWPSSSRLTSGQLKFFVSSPTVFTLTCTGLGGSVSQSITVPVNPNDDKLIFTAVPSTITSGLTSSLITWSPSSAGMYGCNTTSNPNDPFWPGSLASSGGTKSVSPTVTTTYTANCTGSWGAVTKSVTVTVLPNPNPVPAISFTASPTSIPIGNSSMLTWSSTNASTCTASAGWSGAQALSGSLSVSPTANTSYALTCSGLGGSTSKTLTVTVLPKPTVTLSAALASVPMGQSTTLTWSSTNATSCTASGGWSGIQPIFGSAVVIVKSSGAYTLTCTGPGGSVSQSVSISAIPTPTLSLYPSQIIWSSTNTTSCTATGSWTGTQPLSGIQNIPLGPNPNQLTYFLSCTGPGGKVGGSVIITIQ